MGVTGFESISFLEQATEVPHGSLLLGLNPWLRLIGPCVSILTSDWLIKLINVADAPPDLEPGGLLLDGGVREAGVC